MAYNTSNPPSRAKVIHAKINAIPDPAVDPARLTEEQRARYAAYRTQATPPP